ncbi:MAG: response regulator transcription factor [Chloroflexi bacterium]|nr:response regulator transcription factor [Chloroflexota bacterium]
MTSIVLADDHHVVRQGLHTLLGTEADFNVIGDAADGLETIKLVENLQPDILVVDLMMGGMNGLEVARQTARRSPKTGVIILSMYGNEGYVLEALKAGAKAYVLKESTSDELVRAIRRVASGQRYLSSPLSERAIEAYTQRTEGTMLDPYDTLTNREREVLHLVAQGCTNADIASLLYISPRTVEIHRSKMMHKLNLRSQTELLRYSLERGILQPKVNAAVQKV